MGSNAQKFYAVKAGRKPGIYTTWAECQAQTAGFSGAQHKSFQNYADAEAYMRGESPKPTAGRGAKVPSPPRHTYYAVAVGWAPGVYTNWEEAEAATKGFSGQDCKKFYTRREAEEYVHAGSAAAHDKLEERHDSAASESGSKTDADEHKAVSNPSEFLLTSIQSLAWDPSVRSAAAHVAAFKELARRCDELGMPFDMLQEISYFVHTLRQGSHGEAVMDWIDRIQFGPPPLERNSANGRLIYDMFIAEFGDKSGSPK